MLCWRSRPGRKTQLLNVLQIVQEHVTRLLTARINLPHFLRFRWSVCWLQHFPLLTLHPPAAVVPSSVACASPGNAYWFEHHHQRRLRHRHHHPAAHIKPIIYSWYFYLHHGFDWTQNFLAMDIIYMYPSTLQLVSVLYPCISGIVSE